MPHNRIRGIETRHSDGQDERDKHGQNSRGQCPVSPAQRIEETVDGYLAMLVFQKTRVC